MTNAEVIRAWKDPEYRTGLTESERSMLPEHPAGQLKLSDSDLHNQGLRSGVPTTFADSCVRPPYNCP